MHTFRFWDHTDPVRLYHRKSLVFDIAFYRS